MAQRRSILRHAHPRALAAAAAMAVTLLVCATSPRPAYAQSHCGGTLEPVSAADDVVRYSFSCNVPVEDLYEVTAVAAGGEVVAGAVHDAGEGFECASAARESTEPEDPNEPEEEGELDAVTPSGWSCVGGFAASGEAVDGLFTGQEDPCAISLTLRVTVYRQEGRSMLPVAQADLPAKCPASSGAGAGYGATPGGGAGSAGKPEADKRAGGPVVSGVRVSRSKRDGASGGFDVSYRLSADARVTFALDRVLGGVMRAGHCVAWTRSGRARAGCTRDVRLRGEFATGGVAGTNRFHFAGRLRGRALATGAYVLLVSARSSAGRTSAVARSSRFHVARG